MKCLKRKKYYVPIYCYRHFPTNEDIFQYIISYLSEGRKIEIYENEDDADRIARKFLCDDDCYTVGVLDFTHGYCFISVPRHCEEFVPGLAISRDIYEVK